MDPLVMARDLCELCHDELDEREALFVDQVTRLLEAGAEVSLKQLAWLTKLWQRECK